VTVSPPAVSSVDVTPTTGTINVGATTTLTATPRAAGGAALTGRTIVWSSVNEAIATVSQSGLVTGVSAGNATIRATVDGVIGTAAITVNAPIPTVVSVAAGFYHTCALMNNGAAQCWGDNFRGQLGDGTKTGRLVPTPVLGGHTFKQLAVGYLATCGIDSNDVLRCWGSGEKGQLGNGSTADVLVPTPVTPPGEVMVSVSMATNTALACARSVTGKVYCWGSDPTQDINGSTEVLVPTLLPVPAPPVTMLSTGLDYGCGLTAAGAAYCWGDNQSGNLGNGTTARNPIPTEILGNHVFTSVGARTRTSCGLKANGQIWCWGNNSNGQVGDGTTTNRTTAVQVSGVTDFVHLAIGSYTTCGLRANGTAWCWGSNNTRALGDGTAVSSTTPVAVAGGRSYSQIWIGGDHACAIAADGLYCWGNNSDGKLGDGTTTTSAVPKKVL
jgi:alpha-tubulin suppressor-like RCC1 family protein